MVTKQIKGRWFEVKLDLLIPDGEDYPTDPVAFMQWFTEDHGQYISNLTLLPSTAWTMKLDPLP